MAKVVFSGILKIVPNETIINLLLELNKLLPPEAKTLEKEQLHVTLINQRFLKQYKHLMQESIFDECVEPLFEPKVYKIVRHDKTSWIVPLINQKDMTEYVKSFKKRFNIQFEEDRFFHFSLANLNGNPFSSVGDVTKLDIKE